MHEMGKDIDRCSATIVPDATRRWTVRVDAWGSPWRTRRHAVEVKLAAGQSAADPGTISRSGRGCSIGWPPPGAQAERPTLVCAATALRAEERPLGEAPARHWRTRSGRSCSSTPYAR